MRIPKERRPVQTHQLRAIARSVILAEPSISDSEWKARTKEKLATQGWDNPAPEMLETALTNVEKALEKQWGPRPVQLPPLRPSVTQPLPPAPLTPEEAATALAKVSASCKPRSTNCVNNSGWSRIGSLGVDGSASRRPGGNQTVAQIGEWRASTPRRRSVRTANGWRSPDEEG
jgi:hypothetical protein